MDDKNLISVDAETEISDLTIDESGADIFGETEEKVYTQIPESVDGDVDVKKSDEYVKLSDLDDAENKKKFVRSLSPKYKAQMVFEAMQSQEGARKVYGHERRIVLRKMERDAAKGKLDKYFLQ